MTRVPGSTPRLRAPRPGCAALAVFALAVGLAALSGAPRACRADETGCIPLDSLGDFKWERQGTHDAANIRTVFWNFGMVGDYPRDPIGVDLSVFHSAEAPKGSGMNYTDGITPFVLSKVFGGGRDEYIMETGYRERQAISGSHPGELQMRFEPRVGYFQQDPGINTALSPAISNDGRTWPGSWPDKAGDPADPGWDGAWNGYFGKRPAADQESFFVMDDQYYDSFDYLPDSTCSTRYGLGLRVETRGFQWSNPQAGNVIFWHYDIMNESTTDYGQIVFGLYMDSGVGGSAFSCDNNAESDDDNAFFEKSVGLNLVYTWDNYGHGVDLASNCSATGYLGYAYLETPGDPFDGIDNDDDGITDERRDGGPGERLIGQDAIMQYVVAHYDTTLFQKIYGPITRRPAYVVGTWWTGDEDMDWVAEFDDVGGDGVYGSANPGLDGESDGIPTEGEPHFDRTDIDESDQIGLTGFKFNRIAPGKGAPNVVDGIIFFDDDTVHPPWPQQLYEKFTNPDSSQRFDSAIVLNYNIAFLFASGPFRLAPQRRERFSLALAFGADLAELRENVNVVQKIYDANYQFAVPPPRPTAHAEAGDHSVRLSWDDRAEHAFDPVSSLNDFEGYRIYRSTDPEFRDPRVLTSGRGNPLGTNGKPIAQFDLKDLIRGYSHTAVDGVQYWLGSETGVTHTWTDTTATNGQLYYYAVCSYDFGSPPEVPDSLAFYPSENSIPVSRTLRGGLLLPTNVAIARPEPRPPGFVAASIPSLVRYKGKDDGSARVEIVQSDSIVANRLYKIAFLADSDAVIHAATYALIDSVTSDTLFKTGADFDGLGVGPIAAGLLPVIQTLPAVIVDAAHTGFRAGAATDLALRQLRRVNPSARALVIGAKYVGSKSENVRRPGYPADIRIVFYDSVVDTSKLLPPLRPMPAKFHVFAKADTGWQKLAFAFDDTTGHAATRDSTFADVKDKLIVTDLSQARPTVLDYTYQFFIDRKPAIKPAAGDTFDLHLLVPFGPLDGFVFTTSGQRIDAAAAKGGFAGKPYVVPNPYVGSASFEPAPFAVSGRGERLMEFRNVPRGAVIRIYTVHGDLVRTLNQDGTDHGYVPWDLRTKDNLDVAPGLYVYHVDAREVGEYVGKFAIIK